MKIIKFKSYLIRYFPGPSSEGTRSLVRYSPSPNFWLGCYPPMDCIFCLILFIIVAQIEVLQYINHCRNGLLCLGETTSMSCLDSCSHLGLCIWSLHKYYEKLVPICNWRLCLGVFVIANLRSKPPDWERAGQVCPEGHYIIAIEYQNWQSCQTWQRLWDSPMQASHIYHYHVIYQNASFGMYCSNCNVLIMLYNFPTGFLMNKSINIRFHIWYASFGG